MMTTMQPTAVLELADTLYGGALDGYQLIAKMAPTGADLHVNRPIGNARKPARPRLVPATRLVSKGVLSGLDRFAASRLGAGIAVGSTAAGAAIGARELAQSFRKPKNGQTKPGKLLPTAALAGDAVALNALKGDARHALTGVRKNDWRALERVKIPAFRKLHEGMLHKMRRGIQPALTMDPAAMTAGKQSAGYQAGQIVGNRTVQAGLAAGAGAGAVAHVKRNQNEPQYVTDPGGSSPVVKSFQARGEFAKFDDDKRQAFGWASIVELNGLPVVDRQGDLIAPDDLEDAAYRYVLRSRIGGDMHKRAPDGSPHHVSDLIESVYIDRDKIAKMFPNGGVDPDMVPTGWWVGYQFHDPQVWQDVKSGRRPGFSIHGSGRREPVHVDGVIA